MIEVKFLKKMEKKIWKSNFKHGLWDILFGTILIILIPTHYFIGNIALRITMGHHSFIFWYVFLGFSCLTGLCILFKYLSDTLISERVGFVKYRANRKIILKKMIILCIIYLGVILLFFGYIYTKLIYPIMGNDRFFNAICAGLMIFLIPCSITAYLIEFKKLYIYGLLTAIGTLVNEIFGYFIGKSYPFLILLIIGSIIVCIGILIFIRFLKKYPKSV